jgi:hypothetical protein
MALSDSLAALYALNDNAATSVVLATRGNNGTYVGEASTSVRSVAGPNSNIPLALDFDGADDHITTDAGLILRNGVSNDLSIAAWVNIDVDGRHDLIVWQTGDGTDSFVMYITDIGAGDCRLNLFVQENSVVHGSPQSNSDISSGAWHHLGFTKSGGTWTFYKDGAASGTASFAETLSNWGTDVIWLGSNHTNFVANGFDLNGKMAQVGFWNRALSGAEFSQLYNSGNGVPTGSIAGSFNQNMRNMLSGF